MFSKKFMFLNDAPETDLETMAKQIREEIPGVTATISEKSITVVDPVDRDADARFHVNNKCYKIFATHGYYFTYA